MKAIPLLAALLAIAAFAFSWLQWSGGAGALARARELEERVAALESELTRATRPPAAAPIPSREEVAELPRAESRSPVDSSGAAAGRIRLLEDRIAELEKRLGGALSSPADGTAEALTAEALQEQVRRLNPNAPTPGQIRERMALREKFLQQFPRDPEAGSVFEDLLGDYLSYDRAHALDAFQRLNGAIEMEPRRRDDLEANVLQFAGRYDEARMLYQKWIASSEISPGERAEAEFWHAYSYFRQGDKVNATLAFEALLRKYEGVSDANLADKVRGAKNQLEKLKQWP